jgi:hypothetical protein
LFGSVPERRELRDDGAGRGEQETLYENQVRNTTTQMTTQEIISRHMRKIAKKRWDGTTEQERAEHMRMMGQESGKARKPRKTRAK